MSDLEKKIKAAADQFTKAIFGALRSMTIEDIGALANLPGTPAAPRKLPARRTRPAVAAKAVAPKQVKRVVKLSPKARAALQIQGRYIGLLRKFDDKRKAAIKAITKKSGVPAAVAEMKKILAAKAK